MKNVLEYLENSFKKYPDKTAFYDGKNSLTFCELYDASRRIGTYLAKNLTHNDSAVQNRRSALILMDKTPFALAAFFGAAYAGIAYIPAGGDMPDARIDIMAETAGTSCIICDKANAPRCEGKKIPVFFYEEMVREGADDELLTKIRDRQKDTDILYIMFTSGSTGVPKGVMITHKGVILYIESLNKLLGIRQDDIFANQAPFYSDASLKEIYLGIRNGCEVDIVPKQLFLFPVKLVEYLNERKITVICWVSSALSFVSSLGGLENAVPESVRIVTFVGEVFPVKQLNRWRRALPGATFYNLYGPTEVTGVCTAYRIDPERPEFDESKPVSIGKALEHSKIFLLDEEGREVKTGEICVQSDSLSPGYVNNEKRTAEVFVDNPADKGHMIYKTGDLATTDDEGNLYFVSRKDFQIKHMGYRIELGEIEACAASLEKIREVCCVYNDKNSKIVMYFTGDISARELSGHLKERLPRYMIPGKFEACDILPKNGTGKIDRKKLYDMEMNG